MKKDYIPWIVLLLVIGGIVLLLVLSNKPSVVINGGSANEFPGDVNVIFYDANGNPLSIVGGRSGTYFIGFQVNVLNTGTKPLTCTMTDNRVNGATNTAFNTQMAVIKATPIYVPVGTYKTWTTTTGLAVSGFESAPTPDVFTFQVRCSYPEGTETLYLPQKNATISLTIQTEGVAGFNVTAGTGGLSACGDGTCSASDGEDTANCPSDCSALPLTYAKFRTSDTLYPSGNEAIAYSSTCGSNLTRYGYLNVRNDPGASGACPTITGKTLLISGLNGTLGSCSGCSGVLCLYSDNTDTTLLYVAQYRSSTSWWQEQMYDSDDSSRVYVEPDAVSIDTFREVAC